MTAQVDDCARLRPHTSSCTSDPVHVALQAQISQLVHDIANAPEPPGHPLDILQQDHADSQQSSSLTLPSLAPPKPLLGKAYTRSITPSLLTSQAHEGQPYTAPKEDRYTLQCEKQAWSTSSDSPNVTQAMRTTSIQYSAATEVPFLLQAHDIVSSDRRSQLGDHSRLQRGEGVPHTEDEVASGSTVEPSAGLTWNRQGRDTLDTRSKSPDVYTEHNLTAASSGLTPDIESTVDSILQQGSFWNT
jgi:hypothetical protein